MRLFVRRKARLSARQEALAGRLADRIIRWQRCFADWLNLKTAGLSFRSWMFLLTGFCLLFGCYCLWLLVAAF